MHFHVFLFFPFNFPQNILLSLFLLIELNAIAKYKMFTKSCPLLFLSTSFNSPYFLASLVGRPIQWCDFKSVVCEGHCYDFLCIRLLKVCISSAVLPYLLVRGSDDEAVRDERGTRLKGSGCLNFCTEESPSVTSTWVYYKNEK